MRGVAAGAALLGLLAGFACHGDQGPTGGELAVRLASPRNGDRAVSFVLVGPHDTVTAPSGSSYRVFSIGSADGDTAYVAVVAPSGSGVVAGEIARFVVPDLRKTSRYAVWLTDVATASYAVGDTAGVALSIYRP